MRRLALAVLLGACSSEPSGLSSPDGMTADAGGASSGGDASLGDASPGADASRPADAGRLDGSSGSSDGGADGGADGGTVRDGGCVAGSSVAALVACLDKGSGPDSCAAALPAGSCDSDGDGLVDDLETALGVAYGPVFAMNSGASGGNLETHWPANVEHFVSRSRLSYRPDGKSEVVVEPSPSLVTIGLARWISGGLRLASVPAAGEGPDFWLCLKDSTASTRVTSKAELLALPGGVDVSLVVHPADRTLAASTHLFVSFSIFYAYNAHSTLDDHEGDWETVAVFVDRLDGTVTAGWFDRHDSTDNTRFVDVATHGAKDPSAEQPLGNVGSSVAANHGVRFWDFAGKRHHVVAYVATGGHAMYDYPANTYIATLGPRDTHGGDGSKLLTWRDELVAAWSGAAPERVTVHRREPGEPGAIVLPWARFRGQWGCDNGLVGKSWPGPFGNARHPRPLFDKVWGSPPRP